MGEPMWTQKHRAGQALSVLHSHLEQEAEWTNYPASVSPSGRPIRSTCTHTHARQPKHFPIYLYPPTQHPQHWWRPVRCHQCIKRRFQQLQHVGAVLRSRPHCAERRQLLSGHLPRRGEGFAHGVSPQWAAGLHGDAWGGRMSGEGYANRVSPQRTADRGGCMGVHELDRGNAHRVCP